MQNFFSPGSALTIPGTVDRGSYVPRMDENTTIRDVLWGNVSAFMRREYGRENQTRFAREYGVTIGTIIRIKARAASVGIDIVADMAPRLGVEPWQLLQPECFDRPRIEGLDGQEAEFLANYRRISNEALRLSIFTMVEASALGNVDPGPPPPNPPASTGAPAPKKPPAPAPKTAAAAAKSGDAHTPGPRRRK